MVRKVAVIMGSDSDWPVVKGACAQLKALDIPFEAHILSAHRTPAEAAAFAKSAKANGFGVILCAAGMAAHLAGGYCADAQRHPGGNGGTERCQERRMAGC